MLPSPPLDPAAIRSALATQSLGRRIEVYERIGSTNREAMSLAQAGVEHGTVVLADSQTEGRGRLSRQWFSPPDVNLYCSIVIRIPVAAERLSDWLSWLPLMTALAAAEAIEALAATRIAVKWPNDLLVEERKIGGILCESGSTTGAGSFQVIGIGLNVNGLRSHLPPDLQHLATTLREETGAVLDRNRLCAKLLHELEDCLEEFCARGSERISMAYRHRCATIGKIVKAMLTGGEEFVGAAETIGNDGSLTVVQHPLPADGRPPEIHRLRVADIVHLRS